MLCLCIRKTQAQHIFMSNEKRGILIDSLEKQMRKLSEQKQSFRRDTLLFYTIDEYNYHYFEINRDFDLQKKKMGLLPDSMYRIAERIGWQKGIAIALIRKADATSYLGDKASAVMMYERAIKISQKQNLSHEHALALINLAICYAYRKNTSNDDWLKTTEYMNEALKIAKRNNDIENIHQYYNFMGDFQIIRQQYQKALTYYESEYPMLQKHKNLIGYRTNLAYLGICYLHTNQENKAQFFFKRFFAISNLNEGSYATYLHYTVLNQLSNYYLNIKHDYKKALVFQLKYAQNIDELPLFNVSSHYESMSKIYAGLKDYPKAFEYQKKYLVALDSLKLSETAKKFADFESQLSIQRKENNIKSLKNEILQNENSVQKSKIFNLIILFVTITIVLIMFSYANWLKNKKTQTELALLEEREQTENQVIKAQETERNRIAQDLHDEVGNALAALKNLVTQNIKTDNLEDRISQIAQEIRDISHNLASIDFDKTTLSLAFQNLIHRHNEAQNIAYELIEIGIPQKLSPNKALVIYRIACELLNNIHKHSKANKATVQLIYDSQSLTLMVEDDGIGIKTKGNKIEGIGLNHIQTRVAYLNGKLTIDDDGKGTVIIINIPIEKMV